MTIESSNLHRRMRKLLGQEDPELLAQARQLLGLGNTRELAGLLAQGSRKTVDEFWTGVLMTVYGPHAPAEIPHSAWELIETAIDDMPAWTKRRALECAMVHGRVGTALAAIRAGAGLACDSVEGLHCNGPMADLAYGAYKTLDREQARILAEAMMDHGGLIHFNPGRAQRREVLGAFLQRAPKPGDKDAWRRGFTWGPEEIAATQTKSFNDEADPENVVLVLEAGYPGLPIDLLARACCEGRYDVARCLLDWPKFAIKHATDAYPTAWDCFTEEPVLAEGFWHALVDQWASLMRSADANGWQTPARWPDEALAERLASIADLDPEALDPEGYTPAQAASRKWGGGGNPMDGVLAIRRRIFLEQQLPGASKPGRSGLRL